MMLLVLNSHVFISLPLETWVGYAMRVLENMQFLMLEDLVVILVCSVSYYKGPV